MTEGKAMKRHRYAWNAFLGLALAFGACGGEPDPVDGGDGGGTGKAPPVASLEVSPLSLVVGVNEQRTIEARPLDAEGHPLDVPVFFTSADPNVALVSDTGVVTGRAKGQTLIQIRSGRQGATVAVTVEGRAAIFSVSPQSLKMGLGEEVPLDIVLQDEDGEDLSLNRITWTARDPDVAEVDEWGVVRAIGWGETEIHGAIGGLEATVELRTLLRFEELGLGEEHTCGRTPVGTVYCWGRADQGLLGFDPDGEEVMGAPVRAVGGGVRFASLAVGARHACGLDADGGVFCWGSNAAGQLGGHDQAFSIAPVAIGALPPLVALWARGDQTCGLTGSGTAFCWGDRVDGIEAIEGHGFVELAVGAAHVCGRTEAGVVQCWGSNDRGQLAQNPEVVEGSDTPILVTGIPSFARIAAGDDHVCGLGASNGRPVCWGSNGRGELGRGFVSEWGGPEVAQTPFRFDTLGLGARTSCAVATGAGPYCWGANEFRQTGAPSEDESVMVPVKVVSGSWSFIRVWGGARHTCALTQLREAYCWGAGERGQLGTLRCEDDVCAVPQPVLGQR